MNTGNLLVKKAGSQSSQIIPGILNEQSNDSSGGEIYKIAPGENKHPVSLMTDKLCKELAFPVLFS